MHMITSTARRPTPRRVLSLSSARVHGQTRSLALERSIEQQGRVIDEWRWGSGTLHSLVSLPAAVDHPAAFHWHAWSKKNRPSWYLFPFRMAPVLPLGTAWIADILSQASLRDVERQRCWKRGSGDGQKLWDYFTARLSNLSMLLTSEVRRSLELSARPSAAANLYDVLISGERWIVLMLSPIVRDVQRQRCWKRGSGDGQRLSLYDYGTTERSFNALERWGSTLTWTVCTAADSEKRQILRRAYSRRALGCEKTTVLCFLRSWSALLFERGLGEDGRFDVPSRSEAPKTSCQNHKQQLLRPRSGPSKAAHVQQHIPEQPGWKNSKYWANIEKRNQINTKNYWK